MKHKMLCQIIEQASQHTAQTTVLSGFPTLHDQTPRAEPLLRLIE
jgi:hypothetical protein